MKMNFIGKGLMESYSPRILQAHCQSPANYSTEQSYVKELAKPTQDKIVFKNFPTLQKNKKRHAIPDTERQENTRTMTAKTQSCSDFQTRWTRTPAANSTFYRDWETDRKSTRLNSSHSRASRMPSSA